MQTDTGLEMEKTFNCNVYRYCFIDTNQIGVVATM